MATLKEHEILCEQRYAAVEKKLVDLESKIDKITKKIEDFQSFLIKMSLKIIGSFCLATMGAIWIIKL